MAIYIFLFMIVILVSVLFIKSTVPTPLILVITGLLISIFTNFPKFDLNPTLVLDIFLPMLLYQMSRFSSWRDIKRNFRSITLLSVGHVIFITVAVAVAIHTLIPQMGWPLAFVLGSVISPPDDVAIVAIADKISMPKQIVTVLEGEGMLNDATALIIFRYSLAALATHHFSIMHAISTFFIVITCETLYGFVLAMCIGSLRVRIKDPRLHAMISILTPFLAYYPAIKLGGSGVVATVVAGFVMGHHFSVKFPPAVRLASGSIWPAISYAIQNFLFLLVGLNMQFILEDISSMPSEHLVLYTSVVLAVVIIGRFIWVYPAAYLPRFLFPSIRKKDPYPPWQYPFVVSWAGMRGAISLAAAIAVPHLPPIDGIQNPRDFIYFLVFSVILATLVLQGLTLPWLLKALRIHRHGEKEKSKDHLAEIHAKISMINAVRKWLLEYKETVSDNPILLYDVLLQIKNYEVLKIKLEEKINKIKSNVTEEELASQELLLSEQILEIERKELLQMWRDEKIDYAVIHKLLEKLDHRSY